MPDQNHNEILILDAELSDASDSIPTLDLHGFTAENAITEMEAFISHQIFIGETCCRIVHGIGTGVLKSAVKQEIEKLMQNNVIASSFPSRHSSEAAMVVVFPEKFG